MRGFVSFSWTQADPASADLGRRLAASAISAGFQQASSTAGSWAGAVGPCAPAAWSPRSGCLIFGDVYDHPEPVSASRVEAGDLAFAESYCRTRWGRYVMLFRNADGIVQSVFRDPSGALGVWFWTTDGVRIVASGTPDWLMALAPPRTEPDWDRVELLLQSPVAAAVTSALRGLDTVAPGEFRVLEGEGHILWDLDAMARRQPRMRDAGLRLRSLLDSCTGAVATGQTLGIELSGGLDSSIVAGAIGDLDHPIRMALNSRSHRPETDERKLAREVAGRLQVPLTEALRRPVAWTAQLFEATAGDPMPSQNGRDLENDRLVAEACRAAGVDRLLTGKGGDALFFQMHTPLAFADLLWASPGRAVFSDLLPGVARWTRTSVWSVLAAARATRAKASPDDLPPARRLQMAAIASGIAYHSRCLRSDVVDMVHPLMAQPLIEWALGTPVPVLVAGGRDRGLARAVFADRLPPAVASRRAKGDYSAVFNRQVADNLTFVRSYLLDGRLVARGVLDRRALESELDRDSLRWKGGAPGILARVSTEAWIRRWEARRSGV